MPKKLKKSDVRGMVAAINSAVYAAKRRESVELTKTLQECSIKARTAIAILHAELQLLTGQIHRKQLRLNQVNESIRELCSAIDCIDGRPSSDSASGDMDILLKALSGLKIPDNCRDLCLLILRWSTRPLLESELRDCVAKIKGVTWKRSLSQSRLDHWIPKMIHAGEIEFSGKDHTTGKRYLKLGEHAPFGRMKVMRATTT